MTFTEKVNAIIGKPYDRENYHCYDVVEYLVPGAPKVQQTAITMSSIREINREHVGVVDIDEPVNECIVLLGNNDLITHAGVFYNNMIIHNESTGVRAEHISKIKQRFSLVRYSNVS